jgi:hypothetical protein
VDRLPQGDVFERYRCDSIPAENTKTLRSHDGAEPASKRQRLAKVVFPQPGGQKGGLSRIFRRRTVSEDGICRAERRVLVSPDELSECSVRFRLGADGFSNSAAGTSSQVEPPRFAVRNYRAKTLRPGYHIRSDASHTLGGLDPVEALRAPQHRIGKAART